MKDDIKSHINDFLGYRHFKDEGSHFTQECLEEWVQVLTEEDYVRERSYGWTIVEDLFLAAKDILEE